MALVVFLRGINVGGHRRARPTELAEKMKRYGVVSVGAAGTFVVRAPPRRAELRAELRRQLPFETEVTICDGRELRAAASRGPFIDDLTRADIIRFVSILGRRPRIARPAPITLPPEGRWIVKVLATEDRFAFGIYRREMRAIGVLGELDRVFGVPVTTRSWSTIAAVLNALERDDP